MLWYFVILWFLWHKTHEIHKVLYIFFCIKGPFPGALRSPGCAKNIMFIRCFGIKCTKVPRAGWVHSLRKITYAFSAILIYLECYDSLTNYQYISGNPDLYQNLIYTTFLCISKSERGGGGGLRLPDVCMYGRGHLFRVGQDLDVCMYVPPPHLRIITDLPNS